MLPDASPTTGKKRGRPKKDDSQPKSATKLITKIMSAVNNHPGEQILYASTTKGTMKLVVDGHHFRYSFRKGNYTIFQCCYKENKEECGVRVVTDQKRVYPLDGEHVHFIQATDKSVTSVKFTPGEDTEAEQQSTVPMEGTETIVTDQLQHIIMEDTNPVFIDNILPESRVMDEVKLENFSTQEQQLVYATETTQPAESVIPNYRTEPSTSTEEDPNEFREKIKKRLQKALLKKK